MEFFTISNLPPASVEDLKFLWALHAQIEIPQKICETLKNVCGLFCGQFDCRPLPHPLFSHSYVCGFESNDIKIKCCCGEYFAKNTSLCTLGRNNLHRVHST